LEFGGSGGGNTTTVQKSDPWSGVQQPLLNAYSQAENLYENPANYPQYFQGQQVAPLTSQQNSAINNAVNLGLGSNPLMSSASNQLQSTINGDYLNSNPVYSDLANYANGNMLSAGNPYFQGMAQQISNAVTPAVNSSFESAGRYGSGAHANALSSALSNEIGNLAYQNYNQGQQNQLSAAGTLGNAYQNERAQQLQAAMLAPQSYNAQLQGANTALNASSIPQQQQQNEINAAMNEFNYNQNLPYQMNQQYLGLLTSNPFQTGTTTQPYFTNQAAGALGGGLSGALIGSQIAPGIGTAIGGGLGFLMGL
jgi:hypothetical protein